MPLEQAGHKSAELRQQSPGAAVASPTRALLKSALTHIKIMAAKGKEQSGENPTNPGWIQLPNFSKSAI